MRPLTWRPESRISLRSFRHDNLRHPHHRAKHAPRQGGVASTNGVEPGPAGVVYCYVLMRTLGGLFLLYSTALFGQPGSINVSHDLTTLKIAAQNMAPDTPSLDSRPLLEAAVTYAQAHSIPTITSDAGAYYFLTGRTTSRYLNFTGLSTLTFDFAGSDLYFAQGSWTALECDNCQSVQFLNFTLDSLQLPFTQVRVTAVDTGTNRIQYASIPGWEPATNFNSTRNPLGQDEPLYAFVFRGGAPLRATSRISVKRPIDSAALQAASDGAGWSDPRQLA